MTATITRITDRETETPADSAVMFARNLVAADLVTARRIAAALTAILEATGPCLA